MPFLILQQRFMINIRMILQKAGEIGVVNIDDPLVRGDVKIINLVVRRLNVYVGKERMACFHVVISVVMV